MKISKKTREAFQILRNWDAKKYEHGYDQCFCFFYLNDLMEIPEELTDDGGLLEWLTDWHCEDIAIKNSDDNHHLVTFSSKDGSFHALWFYPELEGEPPVIYFEDSFPAKIVASSLEEFVCRLGKAEIIEEDDYYFGLVAEGFNIDDEEKAKKAAIADYEKFRQTVSNVIDCSLFKDRHKLMSRHSTVTAPLLSFKKTEVTLDGDYLASLINLPITDSRVLSVLTDVGYEIPLFVPEKGGFRTPSNKKGLAFYFDEEKKTKAQKHDGLQTIYLETISFDYNCDTLPFTIKDTDNYNAVSQKLQEFNEYFDPEDEDFRYWYSRDEEFYICISFEDDKLEEVYDLSVSSYTSPSTLDLIAVQKS